MGEGLEQLQEALEPVGGQLDGPRDRVDEPAEDDLDRLQGAVPPEQLLHRIGVLLPFIIIRVRGAEDVVHAVE